MLHGLSRVRESTTGLDSSTFHLKDTDTPKCIIPLFYTVNGVSKMPWAFHA